MPIVAGLKLGGRTSGGYGDVALVPRIGRYGIETFTAHFVQEFTLAAPASDLVEWSSQLALQLDWDSGTYVGVYGQLVGEVTVDSFTVGADHTVAAGTHGQDRIELEVRTPSTEVCLPAGMGIGDSMVRAAGLQRPSCARMPRRAMPRTHAPMMAAILGVGLVLVVTRSPGAELRLAEPAAAVRASQAQSVVDPSKDAAGLKVASVATGVDDTLRAQAPASARGASSDAFVIEAPEVLAGFVIPRDRLALLPGTPSVSRERLGFDGRPTLVALVASWCAPCAAELPRLVSFAAAMGLRLVLVSLDDVEGPESLAAVVEDLFARAEPSSRVVPRLELRADPDGAWTDATAPLLLDRGDPGALPQTLLLAGDGTLLALVQGGFDDAIGERLAVHVDEAQPMDGCR